MKTSIKLLPAINTLYEFGLTSKELARLTNNWVIRWKKPDRQTETKSETFLEIISNKIRGTLFIAIKKEQDLIIAVPPSSLHYEKENCIYLTRLSEDSPLHDTLEQDKFYYGYDGHGNNSHISLKNKEILFDRFGTKDIQSLAIIHTLKSTFKSDGEKIFTDFAQNIDQTGVLTSVSELTQSIKNSLKIDYNNVNRYFEGNRYNRGLTVNQLRDILTHLYPDSVVTKGVFSKGTRKTIVRNRNLKFIHSVIEVDNHRFAINIYNESGYGDEELTATLKVIPHTHSCYNYVDVERIWYGDSGRYSYNDEEHKPFGMAMFINESPPIPEKTVLDDYFKRSSEEVKFLSNNDLNLIIKRFIQKENRLNAEKVQKEALDKKISSKLKQLTTDKGKLKINDVVYTKEKISYQGQILNATTSGEDWVYYMLRRQTRGMDYQQITFDNIFDSFVSQTRRDGDFNASINKGTVGEVNFDVTERSSTNVNGITSTRYYMNGSRVNTNEIHHCVERAICYDNQDDYNHFLQSVSSCSIKMHRYLQLGIDVNVRDSFDHTQVTIKFPIERFKNLNYLVLNDQEYKIRDTQKLLRLEKAEDIMQVINVLLSGEVVMGIGPDDIKNVIDAGKQAYVDALAKSKELLEHAENTLGVVEQYIEMKDGTSFKGYLIEGKLRTYAVNAHDDRSSVYDYDTAQYICIVDKSNAAQVGKDMLVNRLFALHNDSVVATKINTLKQRSNTNG
jgi:hypothetical protein